MYTMEHQSIYVQNVIHRPLSLMNTHADELSGQWSLHCTLGLMSDIDNYNVFHGSLSYEFIKKPPFIQVFTSSLFFFLSENKIFIYWIFQKYLLTIMTDPTHYTKYLNEATSDLWKSQGRSHILLLSVKMENLARLGFQGKHFYNLHLFMHACTNTHIVSCQFGDYFWENEQKFNILTICFMASK